MATSPFSRALDLGDAFKQHDVRVLHAAQDLVYLFTRDALDAMVEALWLVIDHPASSVEQICDAWHTIRDLKDKRRYLR